MTTTVSPRSTAGPLRYLPLLVPGLLFLIALAIAPVSPARATDGLYKITTTQFSISHHDIDCVKDAKLVATCTTPVDGKALSVRLDTSPVMELTCTATYDARDIACTRSFDYGPGSHRVHLESLVVSEPTAEDIRGEYPWWSWLFDGPWLLFALGLIAAMTITAGVLTWIWSREPRPAARHRTVRTLVTFVVYWTFFLPVTLVVAPWEWERLGMSFYALLIPHSVLLPAVLALVWQLVVSRKLTGETGQRIGLTAAGVLTTLVCSPMLILMLSLTSGMPD
ncbi:hypothetical protein F4560_001671 [Saccharothrix ecbatanensis]|uniref:Uncharacterized protein n=1 Tax=Saccharothrix ecbatanensis TaxID=1105145 RepID=A0A7W9HGM1_9PSEU|nr:hypothetical protein [Saccharothrix ecbatanensis]MBB5801903.1 hypothetical protein [Saccharothrix ecbatanensis]